MTIHENGAINSILTMENSYFAFDVASDYDFVKIYDLNDYKCVGQSTVKTIHEKGEHQKLVYIGKNCFASYDECVMKVFELRD
jgi:hypothetical protein